MERRYWLHFVTADVERADWCGNRKVRWWWRGSGVQHYHSFRVQFFRKVLFGVQNGLKIKGGGGGGGGGGGQEAGGG